LDNGCEFLIQACKDSLVQSIAAQKGLHSAVIDAVVANVEARLSANRRPH